MDRVIKKTDKEEQKKYLNEKDSGLMAVEALIGFVIFMFSMYTIYSFIWLYAAQSKISHALTEACQSLALESYGNNKMAFSWDKPGLGLKDVFSAFVTNIEKEEESVDNYVRMTSWTDMEGDDLQALARERFYAYLGGDQTTAEEVLKGLGVSNLSFEGTKIEGRDLTIQVTYKIRLLLGFNMMGKTEYETGQSVTCKMWKQ